MRLARAWRRLRGRAAVRAAALVLATLALVATFAEVLAADAPLLVLGPGRARVLLAVTEAADHASLSRDELDRRYAGALVVWPLVRQGPERRSAPAEPPSTRHPLGTDGQGRDVFAALVHGTRSALAPAFGAVLLSLVLGSVLGALAAQLGGAWDEFLARVIEPVQSFPSIVAVALAMALDPDRTITTFALAVAATRWAEVARLVRVDVLRVLREDYVVASRALGTTTAGLLARHLVPGSAEVLAVTSAATLPAVVLLDAATGFLGLGLRGSWGSLLADALRGTSPSWVGALALVAIGGTAIAAKVLADALGDALAVRSAPHS